MWKNLLKVFAVFAVFEISNSALRKFFQVKENNKLIIIKFKQYRSNLVLEICWNTQNA